MRNYGLSFISSEALYNHVKNTVLAYKITPDSEEFNKNLIDPIKLTFDSKIFRKDIGSVIESELIRQLDKTNNNLIGYFHQNIFKYISSEWEVPNEGFDIINKKLNIYVEMKNKHNTMNKSSADEVMRKMDNMIKENSRAICYLVEVISKKSQNIPWERQFEKRNYINNRVRKISIDKFYELVTGERTAFKKLCESLPKIIDDVLLDVKEEPKMYQSSLKPKEISELKSIYLLSFNSYEGFDDFNI